MLNKNVLIILITAALSLSLGCDTKKKSDTKTETTKVDDKKAEDTKDEKVADNAPEAGAAPILPYTATGPIGKIAGKEIGKDAFNEEVKKLAPMAAMMPAQQIAMIKDQIVDNLINKEIIEISVGKIEVKAEEIDKEFKNFLTQVGKQPGGVEAFYQKAGMTEADIKGDIKKGLALKLLLAKTYDIKISDADAKKFYDDNKAKFDEPAQVQASHILFKAEPGADKKALAAIKKKADDVYKAAKKSGADFAALAKEKSEGPSASRGGDLGFFTKEKMVKEFSEAAFKAKKGQIIKPVKTQFGYHVIKVVDKKEGRKIPFAEVKDGVVRQLEMPKMKDAMDKFLVAKKAELKVEKIMKNVVDNPKFKAKAPQANPHGGMGGMGMPPGLNPKDLQKLKLDAGKKMPKLKLDGKNLKLPTPGKK